MGEFIKGMFTIKGMPTQPYNMPNSIQKQLRIAFDNYDVEAIRALNVIWFEYVKSQGE